MITNHFDKGPEGWCSYDYHASMVSGGHNVFILSTWVREGGVNNSGYVFTDHTRWSADTPEKPLSILPLIFYRGWINEDPVDLRNACVSVYLRGDSLKLDGVQCYLAAKHRSDLDFLSWRLHPWRSGSSPRLVAARVCLDWRGSDSVLRVAGARH